MDELKVTFLLSKWLKEKKFIRKASCKHGHRALMKKSAWCDLTKDCTVLKLHDMCHQPKCNCQKQNTFTPEQFHLEGSGFKNIIKHSKEVKQLGIKF